MEVGVIIPKTRYAGAITGTEPHSIETVIIIWIGIITMTTLLQSTKIKDIETQTTTDLVLHRVIIETMTLPILEVGVPVIWQTTFALLAPCLISISTTFNPSVCILRAYTRLWNRKRQRQRMATRVRSSGWHPSRYRSSGCRWLLYKLKDGW